MIFGFIDHLYFKSLEPFSFFLISFSISSSVFFTFKPFLIISSIIFRLVQGEGGHQEIYTCLLNFANFELDHNFNKDMILATESLLVVRILHRLGYVGKNNQFDKEIIGLEFNKEDILSINTKRQEINRSINLALRESHL
jgi:hypothetical protein